jgi:CheY-like chemotaxis protein
MAALRVLHVDDEPDIREIVQISLNLDPGMETRSCASGPDALEAIKAWTPDIVLLDVMMPIMDGPATLALLRENVQTADIPVVFMTARVQTRERDRLLALGAVEVIAKPFDPMGLPAKLRSCVPAANPFAALQDAFVLRADQDKVELSKFQALLGAGALSEPALAEIRSMAHRLAGAAGIFGFAALSEAASVLEEAILAENPAATPVEVADAIGRLIVTIERKQQ